MRSLIVGSVAVALLVACSGGLTTSDDLFSGTSGGTSTTGTSGGGTGTSGGTGTGTSGGGGTTCSPITVDGKRACVPPTARAGEAITVEIDDPSGCLNCTTSVKTCGVSVEGNTIKLAMTGERCTSAQPVGCPAVCGVPSTTCTIPALAAGTYTVSVVGENSRPGYGVRELVVGSAGSQSCTLPDPGQQPPPIGGYKTTCSIDSDCIVAQTGEVCRPCSCPNTAISKTDAEKYTADRRAGTSVCIGDEGIACAACAPMRAKCDAGTCKLVAQTL